MKRLIIYDLDGTLVDTKEDIAQAANYMLGQMQLPSMAAQDICRYVGRGLNNLVKGCLRTDDPQRIEQGMKLYRAYYAVHLLDHSRLYPGVQDVLGHFKQRIQVVITNKPNPYSRDILIGLGVAEYFFDIVAGDSVYPKKPDPAAVLSMIDKAQAAPEETLMIGDSSIDVETGRNAGVLTVGIAQGFADDTELQAASPDALVRNFQDLLALARQRGW